MLTLGTCPESVKFDLENEATKSLNYFPTLDEFYEFTRQPSLNLMLCDATISYIADNIDSIFDPRQKSPMELLELKDVAMAIVESIGRLFFS